MKQIVQNYKNGKLKLLEVPPPQLRPGGVLVQNAFSLISAGTERGMIELGRKSLLQKARARPDLVRKVLDKARTEGLLATYQKARQRLEAQVALGYSCAGIVVGVGEGVTDLEVGDPVACGGIGYASHAEMVFVPRNLCVKVPLKLTSPSPEAPEPVSLAEAAYTTLGAIALEGVRVADLRLGEITVVLGLGLIGLVTVQILRAAGCRVIGLDLNPSRCQLGRQLGCEAVADTATRAGELVRHLSNGHGADAVLVTAATTSSEPVMVAGELARDRGRVVIVGIVGMGVPYKLYYEKALELRLSRSYGPGRYDRFYEEKGLEYPIAYVRWTENRNMQAFLNLVAEGRVNLGPLTTHCFPIDRAIQAYELITGGQEPHIGILLEYPQPTPRSSPLALTTRVQLEGTSPARAGEQPVSLGLIGAGSFTTGVLLQALRPLKGIKLQGICSQGGLRARTAAERFGFSYCTSNSADLFNDAGLDAVLITTRPASHAGLASAALESGKHVFVEKPLAVNLEQLKNLADKMQASPSRILMVGFNRRFSPFARQLRDFFAHTPAPLVASYRVNAGALAKNDEWQHDGEEGGGRIIGETGHFVDLLSYVLRAVPEIVMAYAIGGEAEVPFRHENVALTIRFSNGALGTILYVTEGSPKFPKERLEVFGGGAVGVLDDFRRLELLKGSQRKVYQSRFAQDKGHGGELAAFVEAVRRGGAAPVPFTDYLLTTLCTFQAVASLNTGQPQRVSLALLDSETREVVPGQVDAAR